MCSASKLIWTGDMTSYLIQLYSEKLDQFRDPKMKKKILFNDIADSMNLYGHNVTAEDCDRKWRNLKSHFITVYVKKTKGPGEVISWPYYENMYEILKDDKNVLAAQSQHYLTPSDTREIAFAEVEDFDAAETSSDEEIDNTLKRRKKLFSTDAKILKNLDALEIENARITEITKLRKAVEESNEMQKERNELLKEFLLKMH